MGLAPWPTKPVTPGRVADDVPGVVVEVAAHEQVAGEHLLLDDDLLAVLELDDVLHRDDDLVDALLHVHGGDAGLEVLLDLLLVARLRVHDVPLAGPVVRALDGRRSSSALVLVEQLVGVDRRLAVGDRRSASSAPARRRRRVVGSSSIGRVGGRRSAVGSGVSAARRGRRRRRSVGAVGHVEEAEDELRRST